MVEFPEAADGVRAVIGLIIDIPCARQPVSTVQCPCLEHILVVSLFFYA